MSKKIIKITKEGIRESISGSPQALPTSVEFQLGEATLVQGLKIIENTTGSAERSTVIAVPPCVVILPESPVLGQKFEIINPTSRNEQPIGISSSNNTFSQVPGGPSAIDLSGSYGKAELIFLYEWHMFLNGFTSGSYTF